MRRLRNCLLIGSAVLIVALGSNANAAIVAQWDYTTAAVGTDNITSITSTGSSAITLTAGSSGGAATTKAPSGVQTTSGSYTFNAAQFNNSQQDYMTSSASTAFNFVSSTSNSSFTVEAWVNLASSATTGNTRTVFSTRSPSTSTGNAGFTLYVDATNHLNFILDDGPNSTTVSSGNLGPDTVATGVWTHVAAVYNSGGVNKVTVYLGSTAEGTSGGLSMAGTLLTTDIGPEIGVAGNAAPSTSGWDGLIQLVRISDTAVAPADFVMIPEPASTGLLMLSMGLFGLKRRRRSTK